MSFRNEIREDHPSVIYCRRVLSGDIVACRWVKFACQRHLDDLATGHERGLWFDYDAADFRLSFYQFCNHYMGEWAGNPIEPELWQQFVKSVLYGWKRADGYRRFRTAYIQVARKNGKSTDSATDGLFLLMADGEEGAQIYTAATKHKQATIVHEASTQMRQKSPALKKRIKKFKHNLSIEKTASKYEPIGGDSDTEDGLNVHGAIVDEVHAHKDRGVWDVLETATGSRRQPLMIGITTAGFNQDSIGYELFEYSTQILKGTITDDTFFAIIYTLDLKKDFPELIEVNSNEKGEKEDDWTDERTWVKANPNLGVSVYLDDLQRKCQKAQVIPAAQNNFLTKHLDVWTQQATRWLSLKIWDENNIRPINEEALKGRICYGGIDLSSVGDLTCWGMLFPDPADPRLLDLLLRCWCPESKLYDKKNKYRAQYQAWEKLGFLEATDGDVIDYDYVRARVVDDAKNFRIDSISVDRLFQGYEFSQKLDADLGGNEDSPKVIACGMGYLSMAGPCNELERRLLERKLNHGGNPILRFMADSIAVSVDPAGNKKPNKDKSQGKIDGIISILLGLDRILRVKPDETVLQPLFV